VIESARPQRRARHRLTAAALAAIVVLALVGVGLVRLLTHPGARGGRTWVGAGLPQASVAASVAPDTAAVLEQVARNVLAVLADQAWVRSEYIELRSWELLTLPSPAPSAPSPGAARHIRIWATGRGSSRRVVIDEAKGCPPESDETGDELGPFDGPLASGLGAVRCQVLHEPLPDGAMPDLFGRIAGLYSMRFVPVLIRRRMLRMLAREPGIGIQFDARDQRVYVDEAARVGAGIGGRASSVDGLSAVRLGLRELVMGGMDGWVRKVRVNVSYVEDLLDHLHTMPKLSVATRSNLPASTTGLEL
jgi:hypothetical protein